MSIDADTPRARAERDMLPVVGARFLQGEDGVLFRFVIDTSNVIGPRPATRADQAKHPDAWAAFVAETGISTLGRDASGEAGGSFPDEAVPAPDEQDYMPGEVVGPPKADPAPVHRPRKYNRRRRG